MNGKQTQPLNTSEIDALLAFLLRVSETSTNDTIKRLAKSLFNVISRDKYSN